MKVVVTTQGEVVIDVEDVHETAALIKALQNGSSRPAKTRKKRRKPRELGSVDVPLSPQLVDTWNWLVAHDDPEGVRAAEVAHGLHVQKATAIYRLTELIKKDLAHRVRSGRYRAGEHL